MPSASPNLLNLKQELPSKKLVFLVKTIKIEVMITPHIEIIELPHFGHMTTTSI